MPVAESRSCHSLGTRNSRRKREKERREGKREKRGKERQRERERERQTERKKRVHNQQRYTEMEHGQCHTRDNTETGEKTTFFKTCLWRDLTKCHLFRVQQL